MMTNGDNQLRGIVHPLLSWYDKNARILPWREDTDPYRVWVSEIMLQQTRVETVKPYFTRFMDRLPTVRDLAEVPEEELLKLWEGLGYYSRAKNLQKAARVICDRFDGCFPGAYEEILALPGVGRYTAGAVASIAFGLPTPAVDGNVLRVAARLLGRDWDITGAEAKARTEALLQEIYPADRCGDFTQSIMELGAVVCVPGGAPRCADCPLSDRCRAFQEGTQSILPVRSGKAPRKLQRLTVFLLRHRGRIAVRKRPPSGLLAGMWEFPNVEGNYTEEAARRWLLEQGITAEKLTFGPEKRHVFTHVEWHMDCCAAVCTSIGDNGLTWVTEEELGSVVAMPAAFQKFFPELFSAFDRSLD